MITRRKLLEMVGLGCLTAPLLKDFGDPSVERHPSPAIADPCKVMLHFVNANGEECSVPLVGVAQMDVEAKWIQGWNDETSMSFSADALT